jgi:hypothetical protein
MKKSCFTARFARGTESTKEIFPLVGSRLPGVKRSAQPPAKKTAGQIEKETDEHCYVPKLEISSIGRQWIRQLMCD